MPPPLLLYIPWFTFAFIEFYFWAYRPPLLIYIPCLITCLSIDFISGPMTRSNNLYTMSHIFPLYWVLFMAYIPAYYSINISHLFLLNWILFLRLFLPLLICIPYLIYFRSLEFYYWTYVPLFYSMSNISPIVFLLIFISEPMSPLLLYIPCLTH
jgi:hypothetical protein